MSNRNYRLLFGASLLVALFFNFIIFIYGLIALAFLEGISSWSITRVVSRWRHGNDGDPLEGSLGIDFVQRWNFEAERGLRLIIAALLSLSLIAFPDPLWALPWFMGFTIFGAGVSGVCPMFLALKWIGLK